jgi:hypothetical protein
MSDQEREQHYKAFERSLGQISNEVTAHATGEQRGEPATVEFTITEDQLNAIYLKWKDWPPVADSVRQVVSDPQVRIRADGVVVGGRVARLGSVASLRFVVDRGDGAPAMRLDGVSAGALPAPTSLLQRVRERIEPRLAADLQRWRQRAKLSPPNESAAQYIYATMLLDLVSGRRTGDLAVLGSASPLAGADRWLAAAKVESIELADRQMTVRLRLLSDSEARQAEQKLRGR